jgi:hypothetical protein
LLQYMCTSFFLDYYFRTPRISSSFYTMGEIFVPAIREMVFTLKEQ